MKLCQLDLREGELYARALASLGYETPSLPFEKLEVDRTGYSSQAADSLGEDYLKRKSIVVSTKQRGADMVKTDSVLEFLFSRFYERESGAIDRFTSNPNGYEEPLIGQVRMARKKKSFDFRLRFNTADGTLGSYRDFVGRFKSLEEDLTKLFDMAYVNSMLELKLKLEEKIGAINEIPAAFLETGEVLQHSIVTVGYIEEKEGVTFYKLNNGAPLVVYFGELDGKLSTKDLIVANGEDICDAANMMFRYGYVSVDRELFAGAMDRVLDRSLSELGYNPEEMNLIEKLRLTKREEVVPSLTKWLSMGELSEKLSREMTVEVYHLETVGPDLIPMVLKASGGDLVVSHLLERMRGLNQG